MKTTQRITIALTVDLPYAQAADVEGYLAHPALKDLLEHMENFGNELQADLATHSSEPSTVGVAISTETVRFDF